MSVAAARALRHAIREQRYERVYFFFGEDDFQKENAVRELVAALLEPSTRDFNLDVLRGSDVGADALDTALNTPPLLAEHRVIVVRDVAALSRECRAALDAYVQRPAAGTVLILIAASGDEAESSLASRTSAVEFKAPSPDQIPSWIVQHAASALGVEITPTAAALLGDVVGPDLSQLASELDKLASFTGGQAITDDTVSTVIGVRHGESLGDLLDAVARRDAAGATTLIPHILAQPRVNVVSVIMALTTQALALGIGNAAQPAAGRGRGLESTYFNLLRETRVYPGRSWGEAVASWSAVTSRWSASATDEALGLLLTADHAAKETRLASDEQLLTALVLGLCASGERAAA